MKTKQEETQRACKNCGACEKCEPCDHCNACRNCGKYIAKPFQYWWLPKYPYQIKHMDDPYTYTFTGHYGQSSGNWYSGQQHNSVPATFVRQQQNFK